MNYGLATAVKSFSVKVTRKQLFEIFKRVVSKTLLEPTGLSLESIDPEKDFGMKIETNDKKEGEPLELICKYKFDLELPNNASHKTSGQLIFPAERIYREVIKIILDKNNIKRSSNLDTPVCNISYSKLAHLNKKDDGYAENDDVIKFDFELVYKTDKAGDFKLNEARWQASGKKATTIDMYDCWTCLNEEVPHKIIEAPCPPAKGHEECVTVLHVCTGCERVSGPYVKVSD